MSRSLREVLAPVLGDVGAWERLLQRASSEAVGPGAMVRALGEPVRDILVVEAGTFSVTAPREPPRWAAPGAIIGVAASLAETASTVAVTALRQGRITRIPGAALWDRGADAHMSIAAVARLSQATDHGLLSVPPDPLIVTALLEACDDALATELTEHLEAAVGSLAGGRLVRLSPDAPTTLADALAPDDTGPGTTVLVVRASDDALATSAVDNADRVIVVQPFGTDRPASPAWAMACDGDARRHVELVYVRKAPDHQSRATHKLQKAPRVKGVHLLPDPSPARLELLLHDLRHGARGHEALRQFALFAEMTSPELARIHAVLQWERVDGGSVLLREGDVAADAWFLLAGRLEVVRDAPDGERHLAWLGPGALVGERHLLSGERRTTTVRAVRDSTVARLDRRTFEALLDQSTSFARAIAKSLSARSPGAAPPGTTRARTLAFVPLTQPGAVRAFVADLASACEQATMRITVVDAERLDATLGEGAARTRRGEVGDSEIIRWLDQLERRHDVVVLACAAESDSWMRRAMRQADHILWVADATSGPELRAIEAPLTDGRPSFGAHHLVLLQPPGVGEASGTGRWLAPRPAHAHHHVRQGHAGDLGRLVRRLTSRSVAVAFSGASSRAPAHFGVVRAMADHGLPVDIASGSSSGAGVAAMVAAGMTAEEGLVNAMHIITAGAPRFHQFQPPVTALTSGAAADRVLQSVFGDRQLEDQFVPAVLTAVDIRRHRAVHLRRGPIWKLVRASGSLPLLWPPVWHDDALLVDGGIIDYLPTEVFGDQADHGLLIASNLDATAGSGAPAFTGTLEYGSVMSSWTELRHRLRRSPRARPASLVDILFHTMAIPSFQQQEGLSALARRENVCVITPSLGSYGLFDVTAEVGRLLETATWECAMRDLSTVAATWRRRTSHAGP